MTGEMTVKEDPDLWREREVGIQRENYELVAIRHNFYSLGTKYGKYLFHAEAKVELPPKIQVFSLETGEPIGYMDRLEQDLMFLYGDLWLKKEHVPFFHSKKQYMRVDPMLTIQESEMSVETITAFRLDSTTMHSATHIPKIMVRPKIEEQHEIAKGELP